MTEKSASDVLRELLDERGVKRWRVKWWPMRNNGYYEDRDTEFVVNGKKHTAHEWGDGLAVYNLTPEQAIAATLGRPKAKSHPYGYERDIGAYDCTRCECGCINDISATYCNDCGGEIEIDESAEKEYYDGYSKHTVFAKKHDDGSLEFCERRYVPEESVTHGTLTAEQVREAIYKNIGANPYNVEYYTSIIDHKAIADELNAKLGSGTCKNIAPSYLDFLCSECGFVHYHSDENDTGDGNDWSFCPRCGKKVER